MQDGKRFVDVLGSKMAYVEVGSGDPIVFLHGNPTSSYLWRNVIPHVADVGRCIAPDLIGMGDSDKLAPSGPERYTFAEHRRYLDAFFDALDLRESVTLVVHDWGSGLGLDWARRHAQEVRAIVYMEAIVQPYSWAAMGEHGEFLRALRGPAGEDMILRDNLFVEVFLPQLVLRTLSDDEMAEYRRPFLEPGDSRRPTLTWPRQIPIDGEPPDTTEIVRQYAAWLASAPIPKLLIKAEPGAAISGEMYEACRTWPNQTEVQVPGLHFVQEDSPHEIGSAIAEWYRSLPS